MKSRKKTAISASFYAAGVALWILNAYPAYAAPVDGLVAAGSATIQTNGADTQINQNTDKAIINWQSFDIEKGEKVRFNQPSSSAITLNRVTGNNPSHIFGELTANGRVMLINRSGIVFGPDSKVDVAGLIASTADIDDKDFLSNNFNFSRAGNADAQIINEGKILIRERGLAAFVAPTVINKGIIQADLGQVKLAAGNRWSLDMGGMLSLLIEDKIAGELINDGQISANGGKIYLTANVVQGLVHNAITNLGKVEAKSIGSEKGEIVFYAGNADTPQGNVENAGIINTAGTKANESGGSIKVLGERIALKPGSRINATGQKDGGKVLVGGDYQGQGTTPHASTLIMEPDALVNVSSITNGTGGQAVLWSDSDSYIHGSIQAKGGSMAGDGGSVEASGKHHLDFAALVDTTSRFGKTGTLLLDPDDIVLCIFSASSLGACNVPPAGLVAAGGATKTFTGTTGGATSYVNIGAVATAGSLINLLAANNVVVQTNAGGVAGTRNITVADPIFVDPATEAHGLTLQADDDLTINGAITLNTVGAGGSIWDFRLVANTMQINADLLATGGKRHHLYINTRTAGNTMELGSGGAGAGFVLDSTEITHLQGAFPRINVGNGTNPMNFYNGTWSYRTDVDGTTLNFRGNTDFAGGGFLSGDTTNVEATGQLHGSDLYLYADTLTIDPAATVLGNNAVSNLLVRPKSLARDFGIGTGATSTGLFVDNAMLTKLTAHNWMTLRFGETTYYDVNGSFLGTPTSTMDISTLTLTGQYRYLSARNINIRGAVTLNASVTPEVDFNTLTIAATGSLTNAGAPTLKLVPSQSVGLGDGATATGSFIDTASLGRITSAAGIVVGGNSFTGSMDIRDATWNAPISFWDTSNANAVSINGIVNSQGNNLTIFANKMNINSGGELRGTGTLNISTWTSSRTVGLGDGANNTGFFLDTAAVGRIASGWSSVLIGDPTYNGVMDVTSITLNSPTTLQNTDTTNAISISGTVNAQANNLTLNGNRMNINAGGAVNGTGNLTITPYTNTRLMGLGDTANNTGMFLDTAAIGRIGSNWSNIFVGGTTYTGTMDVQSAVWNSPLTLRSTNTNFVNINGTIDTGSKNLTILANRMTINNATGALTGTGQLLINPPTATTTIGLGTGATAGGILLDTPTLARITDGWQGITFGSSAYNGNMDVRATTWNDSLTLLGGITATVAFNNAVNVQANNLTVIADDINLNAGGAFTGSGTLNIQTTTAGRAMGLGTGALATGLFMDSTEVGRITNGWSNIILGSNTSSGTIDVRAPTWNDDLDIRAGTGTFSLTGATNLNANNLTVTADNVSLTANLSGTGNLIMRPTTANRSMSISDNSGLWQLVAAHATRIQTGWNSILFDSNGGDSVMTIGASTWNNPITFRTRNANMTVAGTINALGAATNALVLATDANFINTGTATALNTGTNRYLIYSKDPALNTLNGLTGTEVYSTTYAGTAPGAVTGTNKKLLYSVSAPAPTNPYTPTIASVIPDTPIVTPPMTTPPSSGNGNTGTGSTPPSNPGVTPPRTVDMTPLDNITILSIWAPNRSIDAAFLPTSFVMANQETSPILYVSPEDAQDLQHKLFPFNTDACKKDAKGNLSCSLQPTH